LSQKSSFKFFVKVEQISIQGDHVHLLIRATRRSQLQNFFRVFSGQIAQRFELAGFMRANGAGMKAGASGRKMTDTPLTRGTKKLKLWKYRPFTRVVRGYRGYKDVRNYIQLNEKEGRGEIPYRKERLKGLSA